MADISKINAVLLANIAEIDDVLAANIAKVNGLVFTTAAALPAPTAAYSMRLLSEYVSYSGPAMRIRRSGDDIEADVEFDTNNEISLSSPISNASSGTYTDLADFVDHTGTPRDAFVDEWKDQSGNAYHAAQGTATSQPKLYDATTGLITENGKSAMDFDGGDVLEYDWPTTGTQLWGEDMSWFTTCAPDAGTFGVVTVQDQSTISVRLSQFHDTNSPYYILILAASGNLFLTSSTTLTTGQRLLGLISVFTSTTDRDFTSYLNGAQVATGNHTGSYADNAGPPVFDKLRIGIQFNQYFNGRMQEVLMYSGDVTTDRADIQIEINDHFQIGNFPNPTSGLLATYTGAAAAYSVRQLANTAALAMRIREDGTDTETDIGFDANGDLDTAAISSHCGSNNGYVVTWYDQAGSQLDATQGTSGSQPQIYNGTSVITENGKPCVEFDGGTTSLTTSTSVNESQVTTSQVVTYSNTLNNYRGFSIKGTTSTNKTTFAAAGDLSLRYDGAFSAGTITAASDTQYLRFSYRTTNAQTDHVNGASNVNTTTTLPNTQGTMVFADTYATGWFIGNVQEAIVWYSDQSSNRSGIETDINTYFSIY